MPTSLVRMVVDNWPDPVLLIDNSGTIVFASKRAEEILGYQEGDLTSIGSAHEQRRPLSVCISLKMLSVSLSLPIDKKFVKFALICSLTR